MKKFKKLFAFLLAMMMVMGLATTALAAPERKEADLTGHTYEAYQIFSGTQGADSAELGNIEWGAGVNGEAMLTALKADATIGAAFKNCTTAKDVADAMKDWTDGSAQAKAFAQIAYNNKTNEKTTVADKNTTLEAGYYLVVDNTTFATDDDGNSTTGDPVYNLSLLQLTKKGTFDIANKTDVPEVDKVIVEGANEVKLNEKGMGKVNTYKITGTLPSNFADYEEYFYWFTDTMSKGLTLCDAEGNPVAAGSHNFATVNIVNGENKTDVSEYFWQNFSTDDNGVTNIDIAIQDLKALSKDYAATETTQAFTKKCDITAASTVEVTYYAVVNKDAVIAGEGNPNDVDLKYSNNPDNNGDGKTPPPKNQEPEEKHPTGTTPKSRVVTYVTELTIKKTDEKGNPLAGAEFTLKSDDMVKVNVKTGSKFEADENGTYYKLANGTYTTTAPILNDIYEEGYTPGEDAAENAKHVKVKNNVADYDAASLAAETMYALKDYEVVEYVTAEGTPKQVVKEVDANGFVTFSGLGQGTYTIVESKTPSGFNTIAPIEFKITFDPTTKQFGATTVGENPVEHPTIKLQSTNTLFTTIINQKGNTLPETGGMGTTIFYVVGAVLVLGAGVLLITKKRMAA